jgi:hypothetical protein
MERWFDLNGASLLVIAEDEALVAPLLPYLGELSRVPSPPPVFVLNISRKARAERVCAALVVQMFTCSVMARASSTSMPR